jgi:hypothetical protein
MKMAYTAFITRLKNVRPHPNADRLQMAECFGNTIVVDMSYTNNQLGIYFPADGQVSLEFAEANNLLRKKDENGNNIGGYMDADKRNVTAIKLRGEKSEGLFLPLTSLESFGDISTLAEGDRITNFNGHEICCKYIPRRNVRSGGSSNGNRTRKKSVPVAPLFAEHADTEQLAYNLGAFKEGDQIEITLKMHGTSQRTGYLPVIDGYVGPHITHLIVNRDGIFKFIKPTKKMIKWAENNRRPLYDWGYVSGTRRVVLENFDGGYYGSNAFREAHSKFFEGKLWKGETVYYEVVGFTHTGAPIMSTADNKKLNDKAFIKQYGKTTTFSYGCEPDGVNYVDGMASQSDIYVYRMTMTNEDGEVVEYTPEFMRYRCEQMGVKTVPVFANVYIHGGAVIAHNVDGTCSGGNPPENVSIGEAVKMIAEQYYDGPDPIGKTHIREGVVVRIVNRPKFTAFKHKNWCFKALEGIVKVEATEPDMEEEQDLTTE